MSSGAIVRVSRPAWICAVCLILSALLLPALLGGCGGDGDGNGVSGDRQGLRIEQFQSDVRFFCSSGRLDLDGAADPLGTMLTAVDNLIEIYKEDSNATYTVAKYAETGDKLKQRKVSIRDLLTESKATLGKDCGRYGRDQARRLESVLGA